MTKEELEQLQFDLFVEFTKYDFVDVTHRDKPDFVATLRGEKIGIELTDGCPEELNRAFAIAKESGMRSFSVNRLEDRTKDNKRKNDEIKDLISESFMVNSEVANVWWANRLAQRIIEKAEKLKAGEIESFERNWLVVSDTSTEIASDKTEFLRAALMASLGGEFIVNPIFDLIYIIGCGNVFVIDKQHVRGISRRDSQG